jgi:hypothetical protein
MPTICETRYLPVSPSASDFAIGLHLLGQFERDTVPSENGVDVRKSAVEAWCIAVPRLSRTDLDTRRDYDFTA